LNNFIFSPEKNQKKKGRVAHVMEGCPPNFEQFHFQSRKKTKKKGCAAQAMEEYPPRFE